MPSSDRPHLPVIPFLLVFQLIHACLLALCLRGPGRLLSTAFLLSLAGFALHCTTGDAQRDYYVGSSLMTQALPVILLNWLSDPMHEFRHECDCRAPASLPFLKRVWWALCILNSPRGVGWSYAVRPIAPSKTHP